jgi:hypothetical protein
MKTPPDLDPKEAPDGFYAIEKKDIHVPKYDPTY